MSSSIDQQNSLSGGIPKDWINTRAGYREGLRKAIELIPEKVDAPQTELIIRGYNQANKELRQALEAELIKESNQ